MNKPKWNSEGEPENLLAAASDAINWLDLLTKSMESGKVRPVNHSEYAAERVRLADCMAALQKFIRDEQVHPSLRYD